MACFPKVSPRCRESWRAFRDIDGTAGSCHILADDDDDDGIVCHMLWVFLLEPLQTRAPHHR